MKTPRRAVVVAAFLRHVAFCLLLVPTLAIAQDAARMDELIRARVDDKSFMGACSSRAATRSS